MRQADIAIVGAGLAGSAAAAMLGRAGHDAVLIDPHRTYPRDFRCEKLDESQLALLRQIGLADAVIEAATAYQEVWVARFGRVVEKRHNGQCGILYHDLVNTVRAQIPHGTELIAGKVVEIATGSQRQTVTLSNGAALSVRLVVLANGLNGGLRQRLGIVHNELSTGHSVSIGFDVQPLGRREFDFPALTYFPEQIGEKIAYLTLFPVGSTMRANLFVYREPRDAWLRTFREAPRETLLGSMPGLGNLLGAFEVGGEIKIRPADLYVSGNEHRAGVVLAGDAFATSCPAAGTGLNKVFTDVQRLCHVHIPRWLETPGMGEDKIASFYHDPVKRACDAQSLHKAYLQRSLATEAALPWRLRRWSRSVAHRGVAVLRKARRQLPAVARNRARNNGEPNAARPSAPF